MMKCQIIFFSVLILTGCVNDSNSDKMYNQELYVAIDSNDASKKGYEILVSTIDTSRKLIKYFWPNGKIQMIAYYHRGYKDGIWKVFMDDGSLISSTTYVNGKKEGAVSSYHPNGKIATDEKYHQGNPVGTWLYYDTLGSLIKTEEY